MQGGQGHRSSRDEEKGGRFYRDLYGEWDFLSTIVEVTTGLPLDEAGLRGVSSNIQNEARRFNLREGVTPADDTLPRRFFKEPLGKEGKVIRREDLWRMLQEYIPSGGGVVRAFQGKIPNPDIHGTRSEEMRLFSPSMAKRALFGTR